ncbi:PilZ domain-containing protein [Methylobacterium organophilum]|uniref:PilZ domain-containing protein n=1 Tax=Methylobacterium organophilum TaxID=410 RepID=UPI001F13852F|nr:PilZ domain-containing protein [Methylobacterium organophilum]UMY15812.1 PilZ domain-containing protein [Methylobacterium organophilum]
MSDRRKEPRIWADNHALIVAPTGLGIPCRVNDRSEGGAMLLVGNQFGIPDRFRLQIESTGESLPARVAWRGARALGVAFE